MRIFIMALEPLETRYTGQWFNGLPKLIREEAEKRGLQVEINNIAGEQTSKETTTGAFLDFSATNIWKNSQINIMAENFANGRVSAGDKILFTDAWNTGILQIRYMSELLGIPVEIHSMWHAGSYDPQDFLGRLIKDKRWSYAAEKAMFQANHFNYFATKFHRELFLDTIFGKSSMSERVDGPSKCVISGQPHNVLVEHLRPFKGMVKKRQVLFPHRVAPEKQPEIFRDLAKHMPDVEFIVCQDKKLTKDEYHTLLGESMIVFSANLQETLGISAMEAVLTDTVPFVPNRLSYAEMYSDEFLYPSEWTENYEAYEANRDKVIARLRYIMDNYGTFGDALALQASRLKEEFLHPGPMLERLLG